MKNIFVAFIFSVLSLPAWSWTCENVFSDPRVFEILNTSWNPYSLLSDVKTSIEKSNGDYKSESLALLEILLNKPNSQMSAIHKWANTPQKALFLTWAFFELGFENFVHPMEYLMKHNPQFQNMTPIRDPKTNKLVSVVTYSLEKEGTAHKIADIFKVEAPTIGEWESMSLSNRLDEIRDSKRIIRFNPDFPYLAKFTWESGGTYEGIWEVKTKKFNFDLDRQMAERNHLTRFFKTGDKIADRWNDLYHDHTVFVVPLAYETNAKQGLQLLLWHRQVHDYFRFGALEEGLHNARHIREPIPIDMTNPKRVLELIFMNGLKLSSVGLRGGAYMEQNSLYGPAPAGYAKVGIEGRTVTRDPDIAKLYSQQVAMTASNFGWERLPVEKKMRTLEIGAADQQSRVEALKHFTKAELLVLNVGDIYLPFVQYEGGQYFNYSTAQFHPASPTVKTRLIKARKYYISELKKVYKNITDLREQGVEVSQEEIEMAVKMTISEWAKMAKVSELYQNI